MWEALLIGCPERRRNRFWSPIDACYEFVGGLRLLWRGFDGGTQAHEFIDDSSPGWRDAAGRCHRDHLRGDRNRIPEPYAVSPR